MKKSETNPTLDAWLAQETAVREQCARGPGPGVARADQVAHLSGLEMMRGVLEGRLPYATISQTLDYLLIDVAEGRAVFQGSPGAAHLNPMGTVHGGWFATLLDSALGCAVHTLMPPGRGYTTAELSVNIVRALTPKTVRVRAELFDSDRAELTVSAALSPPASSEDIRARAGMPDLRTSIALLAEERRV